MATVFEGIVNNEERTGLPGYNTIEFQHGNQNIAISSALSVKYLGITIDSHLRWDLHIYNVTNKLRRCMYPSDQLFLEAKIMDPRQLFAVALVLQQRKCIMSGKFVNHCYDTRQRLQSLYVPRMNKTAGQKSYTYLGPKVYNVVPHTLKALNSWALFKSKIKLWKK
ncbi:hypothetical protein NQ315_014896 [Exocentrus adspersus]|uniref:LAGLIDADG homing endonuclease n=1 Tax=Exocentrus adspersus TaxID=1586481 RepID=A0AAV8VKV2_9CUCU|nr:hypothetical protein NQ315_014896 [Exocentrus adspersus]